MRRYLLLTIFCSALCLAAQAQKPDTLTNKSKTDSIYRKKDSDPAKRFAPKPKKWNGSYPDSTHSPHKAWTRSAFVPGWGQIYNHHWWKVPAIYAGLGLLGNAIVTSQRDYKNFLAVAKYQQLGVPYTDPLYDNDPRRSLYQQYGGFSRQAIIDAKDGYYRNKEISILSFIAVWGVNVIDAYIYGKLQRSFSMDNNFSIKVSGTSLAQPVYASNFNTTFTPALKITVLLK